MCLQDVKPQAYRNAYDIPRRNLLDQLTRMRSNLLRTSLKLIRGQDEGKSIRSVLLVGGNNLMSLHRAFLQLESGVVITTFHEIIVLWLLDSLHSIPVAQMGNYQEYLKMMPSPLREIDPDQPKRLHTFGNPFKQDKKVMQFSCTQMSSLRIAPLHCVTVSSLCLLFPGDDDR